MEQARDMSVGEPDPGTLARQIVDVLDDRKASDIVLLDIHKQSIIADYFIICSGTSDRQVRALTDSVLESVSLLGIEPLHLEGRGEARWVVIDYASVMVHVFAPGERGFYRLEELWKEALVVAHLQ